MCLELPEGVNEHDGIIPPILPSGVSCSSSFEVHILTHSWMQTWILHDSGVWNEGHGEIRMVMRSDDRTSRNFFFGLGPH